MIGGFGQKTHSYQNIRSQKSLWQVGVSRFKTQIFDQHLIVSQVFRISTNKIVSQAKTEKKTKTLLLATGQGQSAKCQFGAGIHKIYACDKFKALSVNERLNIIRNTHFCFNCLSAYHTTRTCKSNGSCGQHGLKHNILLYFTEKRLEAMRNED